MFTIANHHTLHLSESLSSTSLQVKNVGEDVEKREHLYNIGGKISWCSHCGKQYGGSSKKLKYNYFNVDGFIHCKISLI